MRTLQRGIQTAKTQPAEALADLEKGLAVSPESPLGQRAMLVARRAAGLSDAPPGLDEVIDEDSYDPLGGLTVAPARSGTRCGAGGASRAQMPAAPEAAAPEAAPDADGRTAAETADRHEARCRERPASRRAGQRAIVHPRLTRFPAPAKPASDPRGNDGRTAGRPRRLHRFPPRTTRWKPRPRCSPRQART